MRKVSYEVSGHKVSFREAEQVFRAMRRWEVRPDPEALSLGSLLAEGVPACLEEEGEERPLGSFATLAWVVGEARLQLGDRKLVVSLLPDYRKVVIRPE